MITDDKLAELEAAEAKATPGPWYYSGYDRVTKCPPEDIAAEKYSERICEFPVYSYKTSEAHLQPDRRANGAFIALARNNLKKLIDDLRYWKKQCERCAGDNVVLSKQRAELEKENQTLRAQLEIAKEALELSHQCHKNLYLAHWGHQGLKETDDIQYRNVSEALAKISGGGK